MHCVESIQISSFFWSVFSRIRAEYGDLLRSNARKYGPEKNSIFGLFSHSVDFKDYLDGVIAL